MATERHRPQRHARMPSTLIPSLLFLLPLAAAALPPPTTTTATTASPVGTRLDLLWPTPWPEAHLDPWGGTTHLFVDFTVSTTSDLSVASVAFNGQTLPIPLPIRDWAEGWHVVTLTDIDDRSHLVNITWLPSGISPSLPDLVFSRDTRQALHFRLYNVEDSEDLRDVSWPFVSVYSHPNTDPNHLSIMTDSDMIDLFAPEESSSPNDRSMEAVPLMASEVAEDGFDLAGELESLRLLEAQAAMLQAQIRGKKQVISPHIREYRDKLCLKHLIRECDGVVCAARVVVQKICDKVGIETDPTFGYAKMKNPHVQQMIALNDHQRQKLNLGQSMSGRYHVPVQLPTTSPLDVEKESTLSFPNLTQQNTLVKVLSIIATALGITSLVLFIRKRCMSVRKRVEHAADVEERRNARAYRRAARRAEMRRRWGDLLGALNCFRSAPAPPRVEDYEEKRALILQDAFLEQGADQAEKGEIMEAEIRELRHAQEIVSSLVRVDEHRYEIVSHRYDPPPPLVPLPAARSRASTGTLPSYWSESLPDYTSRADVESTPSHSSDEDIGSNQASTASAQVSQQSSNTRYTPTSSLRETSPRVSAETLRTRQSREKDS